MKVALVIPRESFFQIEYAQAATRALAERHQLKVFLVGMGKGTFKRNLLSFVALMGVVNLAVSALRLQVMRLAERAGIATLCGRPVSPAMAVRAGGVEPSFHGSIHDESFVTELARFQPDLVVNNHNQIYKDRHLAIPRLGILNCHVGRLPRYRSPLPVFWTLMDGEDPAVTFHLIDAEIDRGRIVLVRSRPYAGNDMFGALRSVNALAAECVAEAVERCAAAGGEPAAGEDREWPYRPWPRLAEVREFRRRGWVAGRIRLCG